MARVELCPRCHGTGYEPDWRGIGTCVRHARLSAGLHLRELAHRCRISPSFLSDLELGRRSWMGPAAQRVLAHLHLTRLTAFTAVKGAPRA